MKTSASVTFCLKIHKAFRWRNICFGEKNNYNENSFFMEHFSRWKEMYTCCVMLLNNFCSVSNRNSLNLSTKLLNNTSPKNHFCTSTCLIWTFLFEGFNVDIYFIWVSSHWSFINILTDFSWNTWVFAHNKQEDRLCGSACIVFVRILDTTDAVFNIWSCVHYTFSP